MKVLKFGGTSVGSVNNILSVKQIVESIDDQVIVVVSALGGITDKLIETSRLAANGDATYLQGMQEIINRHIEMVTTVIPDCKNRGILFNRLNELFNELQHIFLHVFQKRDLSAETSATIVSYGERMSSLIVSCLIKGSRWFDSRTFIKTEKSHNKFNLDSELTARLVRENLSKCPKVSLVPGFISTDKNTGETTNLGRGGSDYTASIIASALNADCLEIWTDVDGFMTADPRITSSAYPIEELSYDEAIELCNSGAKVIYPPTINPVCTKNIPILIKNTMHPDAPGTIIKRNARIFSNSIKGISSIKDTSLVSIAFTGITHIEILQNRVIQTLKGRGIDCFVLSKSSSTDSIALGLRNEDTDLANVVLVETLVDNKNLFTSYSLEIERNLALITIVGEQMKQTPAIAQKLYRALQQEGIQIKAATAEDADKNLSFVTNSESLCKAINIAHDICFALKHYTTIEN